MRGEKGQKVQYEPLQISTEEYNTAVYSRVGRAHQCIAAYRTVHYTREHTTHLYNTVKEGFKREGFTGGTRLSRFLGPSFTCLENKVMSIHFRYSNINYLKSLYSEVGIPRFDY